MTTTKRDLVFLAAIFLGMAMAEPTLEKQFNEGLNPEEREFFYKTFGNLDNQEGVSDERTSQNEQ
jgi:transketolase